MRVALGLARRAGLLGEVPVGAVVVLGGEALGHGYNAPISRRDPTAHAEIVALRDAAERTGNYRLPGATLYSTVEPCLMCIGAALHARIARLVYAASDPKVGCVTQLDRLRGRGAVLNHRFEVDGGVLAEEAGRMLREFFAGQRREDARHEVSGWTKTNGEVPKWS